MVCHKRNTGRLSERTWLTYCTRMMRYYTWCSWEEKPYNLINFFINWKDKTYKSCVRSALRLSFLIKQIVLSLLFWNLSFCAKNMSFYLYVCSKTEWESAWEPHIPYIVWFLSVKISLYLYFAMREVAFGNFVCTPIYLVNVQSTYTNTVTVHLNELCICSWIIFFNIITGYS